MKTPIILVAMLSIMVCTGVLAILQGGKGKKEREASKQAFLIKAYNFLSNMFLTSGKMQKIYNRIALLSIYSREETKSISAQYYLVTTSVSIGILAISILLFEDVISVIICACLAVIANNILIDKQVDSQILKVNKSLKNTLSSIRQEYIKHGSVVEAVAEAEKGDLMKRPMEEIHAILTGGEGQNRLHKFYETSHFRPLQTLASICYNINNSGDTKGKSGESSFIEALVMLTNDVNSEIQRLETLRNKFGRQFSIEYLTFIPILGIPLIETFFSGIMPGTSMIYRGPIGYACRAITLIISIVCYNIVANINRSSSIREDDRSNISRRLLNNSKIRQIVNNIVPKGKNSDRVGRRLKSSLSRKSPMQLYTDKIVWAFGASIIAAVILVSTITMGRDYIYYNTNQIGLITNNDLEGYSDEQILELDNLYLNRDHEWDEQEFKINIAAHLPKLSDLQIYDQISRLKDKETGLKAAYLHWYYTPIVFIAFIIGWCAPNISLNIRNFLVVTEAEDDFLQLQTLMAILINTEIDTLEALEQMANQSRIHKEALLYCYHSYPSEPYKELARLQSKTPIIEFKRFIGKMISTVSDLSLKEAFNDLKIEREHMARVREMSMYASINKKRALCGVVSLIPMALLVICELLVPLGYLGYVQFSNALSGMRGL